MFIFQIMVPQTNVAMVLRCGIGKHVLPRNPVPAGTIHRWDPSRLDLNFNVLLWIAAKIHTEEDDTKWFQTFYNSLRAMFVTVVVYECSSFRNVDHAAERANSVGAFCRGFQWKKCRITIGGSTVPGSQFIRPRVLVYWQVNIRHFCSINLA